jgi:hypothetical protein
MPEPEDFDDSNEIQLTVVRGPSTPPYEKGVRTRLTARTFLRIIKHIETGWAVTQSCKAEGFTYRRFRQLCQRWPIYQARFEKAEVQRAEHRRETMERIVLSHAVKNWQAAGWWLERAHPDRYSLKTVHRDDGTNDEQAIGNQVPLATLVEDARLAAEVALQKPPGLPDTSTKMASTG